MAGGGGERGGGRMSECRGMGLEGVVDPIVEKQEANARVVERTGAVALTSSVDSRSAGELIDAVSALHSSEARQAMADAAQAARDNRAMVASVMRVGKRFMG